VTRTICNTNKPHTVATWRTPQTLKGKHPPVTAAPTLITNAIILGSADKPLFDQERLAVAGWISGYHGSTRTGHLAEIRLWTEWLSNVHGKRLFDATRLELQVYGYDYCDLTRHLKQSTIAHKMSVICGFYKWCAVEGVIDKDPVAHVRRPRLSYLTTREYLDRDELSRFLFTSERGTKRDQALCYLLALNGLRISEALNADISDMGLERGHRTLHIVGKGRKEAVIPLAPKVATYLDLYLADRTSGPLFLNRTGEQRMDRHAAARIVNRIAKKARIDKHISPHCLRHSFITAALDAGVSLRDVQHAARHADPRTTSYYDHGRKSLDSHATYIVSAFVAAGS
jgi:site-specific recombinase XerD